MGMLEGKLCIVTGAARGLGKAAARRMIREGARVILADIDEAASKAAAVELSGNGSNAYGKRVDVSRLQDVEALAEWVAASYGPVDVLVNNAAVFAESVPLVAIADEEWDRVMTVNLKGVFNCSKVFGRRMLERGSGSIVNVTSFTGKTGRVVYSEPGTPTKAHYCASKAGIISLTRSLAWELAPAGIRVNAVAPGSVSNDTTSTEKNTMLSRIVPLGRTGTPDEVAALICFLASPEAEFITGEVVNINGGTLMD